MDRVGAAVVGGGAVGTAVALALAAAGVDGVVLLERNQALGEEQSGRSSGVVHAGVYYPEGTLKARLCVAGNASLFGFCAEHRVACARVGKLMVAPGPEDLPLLEELHRRARAAGSPGVELLSGGQARRLEPGLRVAGALRVPGTGIVDAASLVQALRAAAEAAGALVLTGFEVVGIDPLGGGFEVRGRRGDGREERFRADLLVNAAGLACAAVGRMLEPDLDLEVVPLRGEYARLDRRHLPDLGLTGRNLYPVPEALDLGDEKVMVAGVHITPTFGWTPAGPAPGDLFLVGPEFVRAPGPRDLSSGRLPPSALAARAARYLPDLCAADLEPDDAGIMVHAVGATDWTVRTAAGRTDAAQLLGIDSPGLTCCLELATEVRRLLLGA